MLQIFSSKYEIIPRYKISPNQYNDEYDILCIMNYIKREISMNCGNNNSGYDRMNRCCEKPRREMPKCESVRPARECVKPSCGCERTHREYTKPNCGCERTHSEYMKPDCGCERTHREYTRPSCGYEMPHNECVKPSHRCAAEEPMVENIIVVNDCSCQEFMRLYDWYNCTADKAHREFMGAEKGLNDAADCIKMGLEYNVKAKEIFDCMEEFLDSMNETDSCENKTAYDNTRNMNSCGCNTNCGCNTSSNNSCMPRCTPIKCDPCMKMREELKEMMCTINKLEEESLEHTKAATDKLMEARRLHKCLCELKNKVAKSCYPKC